MTENKTNSNKTKSEMLNLITEGIYERKGRKITLIDLSHIENSGVSSFVICEGTSSMHVSSVADSVREYVQEHGDVKPFNYDGYKNSEWIVIDYGDTLVHIFLPEARDRYKLEELWSDAKITELPDPNF